MKNIIFFLFVMVFISCESDKKNIFEEDDKNSLADENSVIDADTGIDSDSIVEDKDTTTDIDAQDIDLHNDIDESIDIDTKTDVDVENDSDIDSDSDVFPDEDIIIPPFCGDKNIDEGEDCDDGNKINTDSCKNDCTYNTCGDGYVYAGVEICDSNTSSCLSIGIGTDGTVSCNIGCTDWISAGICTRDQNCSGLPANSSWNTASSINQTWDGTTWIPSALGTHSLTPSVTECVFACNENYSWNSSQCTADIRTDQPCAGLPANALWNTASSINQTWSGSSWTPSTTGIYNTTASATQCRFKCDVNYTWNSGISQCIADTRTQSCSGLPSSASWNTVSYITQTWSGSVWLPAETGVYNTESSTTECRFKCNANYSWNDISESCVADTKVSNCTSLPANAGWNTASSITQTWSGSAWLPTTAGAYNTSVSTTECRFKCNTNYTWNSGSSTCIADIRTNQVCTGLPSNAAWNTATNITQTWSGSAWLPTTAGAYNTSVSTTECRFKCNTNYTWNSGTSTCIADTRLSSCANKPSGTVWNDGGQNGVFTQTWNGSSWTPASVATTYNILSGNCRYICAENFTWSGSACLADTRTVTLDCTGLPANASWNTVGSVTLTQTWSGSEWIPTTKGIYDLTPSTTECRFKCNADYGWNGIGCIEGFVVGAVCTGQTKCYNGTGTIACPASGASFYGQDAQYLNKCKPASYSVVGSGAEKIVVDNNTGLQWQQTLPATFSGCSGGSPVGSKCSWQGAISYCTALTYGGYSDWRLPKIEELETLLYFGVSDYRINITYFPYTMNELEVWSSSLEIGSVDYAWYANYQAYYGGLRGTATKLSVYIARCVR